MYPAILKRTLLLCSAFVFGILSCYSQNESSDQLEGTWTKVLNGRTVTFTIAPDQTYQVEFIGDADTDVYGKYKISGSQVTFNDEGGDYAAKDAPGVYEFQFSDSSVTFTEVDDPLPGRKILLVGKWSRADQ